MKTLTIELMVSEDNVDEVKFAIADFLQERFGYEEDIDFVF